jgi:cytochrome c-type biogenesis protein CcmH
VKILVMVLLLGSQPLMAGAGAQSQASATDVELEARLQAFLQEIRCLVCQNETLADSRAELAVDLRNEVRSQMMAGRSDGDIRDFLVARYGDFVLYRPPLKPSTYALWFGPFALLGSGLLVLYRAIRSSRTPARVRPPSGAELKRVRRLLDSADQR